VTLLGLLSFIREICHIVSTTKYRFCWHHHSSEDSCSIMRIISMVAELTRICTRSRTVTRNSMMLCSSELFKSSRNASRGCFIELACYYIRASHVVTYQNEFWSHTVREDMLYVTKAVENTKTAIIFTQNNPMFVVLASSFFPIPASAEILEEPAAFSSSAR